MVFYFRKDYDWWPAGSIDRPAYVRHKGEWKKFAGGPGVPMNVRTFDGQWIKFTSEGDVPLFVVDEFVTGGLNTAAPGGVGYDAVYDENAHVSHPIFYADQYWRAGRIVDLEYAAPYDGNVNSFSNERYHPGTQLTFGIGALMGLGEYTDTMQAHTVASTGWIGDEFGTYRRYIDEMVSWYSLPIGLFLEAAKTRMAIYKFNARDIPNHWSQRTELVKVEVESRLGGYSLNKQAAPWFNSYYESYSTIGLHTGVGALRFQGPTAPAELVTVLYDNGVFTTKRIVDKPFNRDGGEKILWTGDLNDLGNPYWIGANFGTHGIPRRRPGVTVVQNFDPRDFTERDCLQYHLQTSPLADPPPFTEVFSPGFNQGHSFHNEMNCIFAVRVYWSNYERDTRG